MESIHLFWNLPKEKLLSQLHSSDNGLSEQELLERTAQRAHAKKSATPFVNDVILFISQFKSPLVLLLVFAVILSIILKEYSNGSIILSVLLVMGLFGFVQERNAGRAVQKLKELVHNKALVRRQGVDVEIFADDVVEGDIVKLSAGDMIPADCLILEATDLHVNESVLTGESFPAEKFAGICAERSISKITNAVFKGTSVVNGTAVVVAVNTGKNTELGKIATTLEHSVAATAFEKDITQFGYLLMRLTIIFSGLILVLNLVFQRPFIESILFSLALAIGLTPELLPAILTITLSAGAKRMAKEKVIVKRLAAIQNLGGMDILCSDKTGTITEGKVELQRAVDVEGTPDDKLLLYAYLNASFETGFNNPIDQAIRALATPGAKGYAKCDEVPYDFIRKRLTVSVAKGDAHIMITKGAVPNVLDVCTSLERGPAQMDISGQKDMIQAQFEGLCKNGFRVIGLAYKELPTGATIDKDDEKGMVFMGFLVFSDPLKEGIADSIDMLKAKGISLRIITGDNQHAAINLARQVKLRCDEILTGDDIQYLTADALQRKVETVDVFAEVLPAQKERIIRAFQKNAHSVGYLGDGINDANALKAADVGISIDNAVDVAKEAADLVLMDRNIDVIAKGVELGRKTFVNSLKYIYVSISANFGNMFSMAVASLIFPFVPLLPVQILLNNFLADLPAITLASDNVDSDMLVKPRKWSIAYVRRFMIVFGLQSSIFDFMTFGLLYYVFHSAMRQFRTAWFVESLLTQIMILLVIRTQKPFFKSQPSGYLLFAAALTIITCLLLPYLPVASLFGFTPLPLQLLCCIVAIAILYIAVAEISKRYLIKKI